VPTKGLQAGALGEEVPVIIAFTAISTVFRGKRISEQPTSLIITHGCAEFRTFDHLENCNNY